MIDRVRELEQHFGYLLNRYLQFLRGKIISSRDHSVMMSGDSIIDSIGSHRLRVCDPVSPTPGRRLMGTRLFHFRSRCLVLPLLIRRLDPSSLQSRRLSLGRRSWVGTPRLVWVGLLLLFLLLFLLLSLLGRPLVASGVASFASAVASVVAPAVTSSVSSGSEGCVPQLPAYQARRLRSLLRFPLLSLFLWPLFLLLLLCFLWLLFHLRRLLPLVFLFQSPSGLGGGGGGGGGSGSDGGSCCQCGLPDSDQAGIYSDPLNFPQGEESDTQVCSEATGAFRQVLSFIASFFPEILPSESHSPHFAS